MSAPSDYEPIDYEQWQNANADDPILRDLLFMPVKNMNEAGAMLHFAPRIARYLRQLSYQHPSELK